jgi:hypothetical protein
MGYNHVMNNLLVKVSDDGKTAMSTATLIEMSISSPGHTPVGQPARGRDDPDGYVGRIISTGTYRNYYRKTPEGWKIAEVDNAADQHPLGLIGSAPPSQLPNSNTRSATCNMNGPIDTRPNQVDEPLVSVPAVPKDYADHPTKDEVVQPQLLYRNGLFSEDHTADVLAIEQVETAYSYYNDSHGGPGMASLFTDDGVSRVLLENDLGKRFEGIVDSRCPQPTGHQQIATKYGYSRTGVLDPQYHDGLPFPMGYNHNLTNLLVKVSDDGKTAMLTATLIEMSISSPGHVRDDPDGYVSRIINTGTYRDYFRKTPEGWRIAEKDLVNDKHPLGPIGSAPPSHLPNSNDRSAACKLFMNAPIPSPK